LSRQRIFKTRTDYWRTRIERNKERDLKERLELKHLGWHVIQIWECQLKPKEREATLKALAYTINEMMLLNYEAKGYASQEEETMEIRNVAEE
jgi:DNA mismatch endonuclease (patch repair protein)